MASKYSDLPIYRLNKFIEEKLREEGIIPAADLYVSDTDTQEGFVLPFMTPAGVPPETMTIWDQENPAPGFRDLPICTYTNKQDQRHDRPWKRCWTATYVFYSGDIDKLFEISAFVEDLVSREDWSAYDINYFYREDPTFPFDFKSINLLTGVGPTPATDEGGLSSYMCVVQYDCTYEGPGRTGEYGNESGRGMW